MCPICFVAVSTTERELLSHVLAKHAREFTVLSFAVTLAQLRYAGRPSQFLAVNAAILLVAVALARGRWNMH